MPSYLLSNYNLQLFTDLLLLFYLSIHILFQNNFSSLPNITSSAMPYQIFPNLSSPSIFSSSSSSSSSSSIFLLFLLSVSMGYQNWNKYEKNNKGQIVNSGGIWMEKNYCKGCDKVHLFQKRRNIRDKIIRRQSEGNSMRVALWMPTNDSDTD